MYGLKTFCQVFVLLFFAVPAFATITAGQETSNASGGSASFACTLGSNPTPGDLVIVGVVLGSNRSLTSVKDGNMNTFNIIATSDNNTNRSFTAYWTWEIAPANAEKTLTVAASNTGTHACFAKEFANVASSSTFDTAVRLNSTTASTSLPQSGTNPNLTPSNANELIVIVAGSSNPTSVTANFTLLGSVQNTTMIAGYAIQSGGPTNLTGTVNQTGNVQWAALMASFNPQTSTAKHTGLTLLKVGH